MNYSISKDKRILVIGDLMLDHYIYGNCNRISPEAPVQVVDVKREEYTLGGAGNVLKNLKAFNNDANIISIVGDDDNAQIINARLAGSGIDNKWIIKDRQRCTTTKSRVLASNHQLIRLDREDTWPINEDVTLQLIGIITQEVKNCDIILLSDYDKGLLTAPLLAHIFTMCREAGIKTLLDPKGTDFAKYQGVNIIKPNKKEASIASGIVIKDNESLKAACEKIRDITGCDDVVVTMSEDGIALFTGGELTVISTKALDILDVTGAGDTVLAALGLALASGNTLPDACDFANHAAAVVVNKVGSATATLEEIALKFLN